MYMRNCDHDPQTARFTQEDPIGLSGGLNLYGYAGADPVNQHDPFGLCTTLINSSTGDTEAGPTSCKLDPIVVTAARPNRFLSRLAWLWRELNTGFCPECSKGYPNFAPGGGLGPIRAVGAAANVANASRLRAALTLDEAASVFTSSGQLHGSVIATSTEIIRGSQLKNAAVIGELTRDGSRIADWGKYTTGNFNSPVGQFQVHFYRNRATGHVNYNVDYQVKFSAP